MDILNQPQTPQPGDEQTSTPPKPSFHSKTLLIAVVVFIVIMIGLITYVLAARTKPTSQPPSISPTLPQPSPTIDPTANWKTYRDIKWQYKISYPDAWILEEHAVEDFIFLRSKEPTDMIDIPKPRTPIYRYIQISVFPKIKASLEEDARGQGQAYPQCGMGSPCEPFPAKQVQKKYDPRFKELYEVVNAGGRKIIVFSFPTDNNHYIVVEPFSRSKFFSEVPEVIFDQILSTFKFTNQ